MNHYQILTPSLTPSQTPSQTPRYLFLSPSRLDRTGALSSNRSLLSDLICFSCQKPISLSEFETCTCYRCNENFCGACLRSVTLIKRRTKSKPNTKKKAFRCYSC